MNVPVTFILGWLFTAVFPLSVHAADVTPFHVVASSEQSVTIDLDKNIPAPGMITVFGSSGWTTATLQKRVKQCEYLCGEGEGKECHNEGIYHLNKNELKGSLVGSLMAVAGKVRIQTSGDPIQFKKSTLSDDKYISTQFSRGYRWGRDEADGKTYLFSKFMGPKGVGSKDWYAPPIRLDSCDSRVYGDFNILGCRGVNLLYHQGRLIELSMAEYSSGKLDLKFKVRLNGKMYYAVEVSVKGHGQRLKLITRENGTWIGYMRYPTYAALC